MKDHSVPPVHQSGIVPDIEDIDPYIQAEDIKELKIPIIGLTNEEKMNVQRELANVCADLVDSMAGVYILYFPPPLWGEGKKMMFGENK